ncbi:FecR family protein [bacterium A37T11]|nr:FecR family protein [bacterium A37T11]
MAVNEHIKQLFAKYLNDTINDQERHDLLEFFGIIEEAENAAQLLYEAIASDQLNQGVSDERIAKISVGAHERLERRMTHRPDWILWKIGAYAAAALVIMGVGLFFINRPDRPLSGLQSEKSEILPGFNQATLTFNNGTTVKLDSSQSGIIVHDGAVNYANGSSILGLATSDGSDPILSYAILTTPKGGQYQIILPDGTKVWLNAASMLKYPTRFKDTGREVILDGEGYFEIKEDRAKPFRVWSKNQEILVLGTSFNVNSYDTTIKTTLVSGAVKVLINRDSRPNSAGGSLVLAPGEQATVQNNGNLIKVRVDISSELAWRNGQFNFQNETLVSIMQQIARWYNVDVEFKDEALKNETYAAISTRFDQVAVLLNLLEKTGDAHFTIHNRTIIISKK